MIARRALLGMATVVALLMVTGWGGFFFLVLPGDYFVGDHRLFGTGLALTAFTLGMRHAFDADHIAAIDNTTRKLVADGQQPVSVGFWFALGHSTVVVAAVALLAAGLNVLADQISAEDSTLTSVAGLWGPLVSGLFLLLIGTLNLVSLVGIVGILSRAKDGSFDEAELEHQLQNRGGLYRILGPIARSVDRPWKMYPVGLLFGLGFDTATTISLFVIGGSAALTAPWYVVLILPVLFTAGMTLFDSLDGLLMRYAYEWAYDTPIRKVYYNLVVTVMSVAVAFLVAGVCLVGLLADRVDVNTGPLAWVSKFDLGSLGFIMVSIFAVTWGGAVAYWKLAHVEERYSGSRSGTPAVRDKTRTESNQTHAVHGEVHRDPGPVGDSDPDHPVTAQ